MNTCDTCKWWGNKDVEAFHGYKECKNIKLINCPFVFNFKTTDGKIYDEFKDIPEEFRESADSVRVTDKNAQDGLSAGEAWSYICTPMVGPKFGCIHWEKKT